MKYIIKESQIKKLIKKYFDKDFSLDIKKIEFFNDLPDTFQELIGSSTFYRHIDRFGPMYLISTSDYGDFLAQDRIEKWTITNYDDIPISEDKLMSILGIAPLGLSMQELIDAYIDE